MVDAKSLLEQAQHSDEGEAYVSVGRGPGFRIGLGARTVPDRKPVVFIEVVLDPFPDRPSVSPQRLAEHSAHLAQLGARGYSIVCDDDGTITCERSVFPETVAREIQAVRRLLGSARVARHPAHTAPARS